MKGIIIYLGNFQIEDTNAAGKRVLNNARLFRDIGYTVYLLGSDRGNSTNEASPPCLIENSIYYSKYPESIIKKWNTVKKCNEVFNSFYYSLPKCDFIITYGSVSLSVANLHIINFAKKNKTKVLVDVVDWLKPDNGTLFFRYAKQIDIDFRMKIINRKYDGIIVISNALMKYYNKRYNNSIVIIPPLCESMNSASLNTLEIPQVVYAGVPFSIGKKIKKYDLMKDRFDLILRLLNDVKNKGGIFEFHIYGFTQEQLLFSAPKLENYISNLDGYVYFHGKVDMTEVEKKLCETDYTILIRESNKSTNAGFPTKIVESICSGVPMGKRRIKH